MDRSHKSQMGRMALLAKIKKAAKKADDAKRIAAARLKPLPKFRKLHAGDVSRDALIEAIIEACKSGSDKKNHLTPKQLKALKGPSKEDRRRHVRGMRKYVSPDTPYGNDSYRPPGGNY